MAKTVRVDQETLAHVDRVQETIQRNHPGRRVSREGLVRELLRKAVEAPTILRDLGADVRRGMR